MRAYRYEQIMRQAKKVAQELSSLTPLERIIRSVEDLRKIDPQAEPKQIVMNEEFFTEWFYYAKENGFDFKYVGRAQVILDKESPCKCAIILKQ